jgi:putative ABC transport system substrate-binding protein
LISGPISPVAISCFDGANQQDQKPDNVLPSWGRTMRRRDFIKAIGVAAAAWPRAARAQPANIRRIGFLFSNFPPDDMEGQARGNAFVQGLQERGWSVGRNVRIEYRWGLGDVDRLRILAEELVRLAPDVLFAAGSSATAALRGTSHTVPIVFANVPDPVGSGYVNTLARPGGNATGFMTIEFGQSGKWLELLKQIAPHVTRVAVLRGLAGVSGTSQYAAIQAVAPLLGVEVSPISVGGDSEMERAISDFASTTGAGLIVPFGIAGTNRRDLIIAVAARHRLPAVYFSRDYALHGGLISLGVDILDLYRRSATYVDRILKGEKPADLPVQAPTKYETVLNLKTAKALGLQVPDVVRLRADEVIE